MIPRQGRVASAGAGDICANGNVLDRPLALPGRDGWLGWLDARAPLTLRATATAGATTPLSYVAANSGMTWRNPTLVAGTGARMRVTLDNALDAPTIVHWHGLAVDTLNDGNGESLAQAGGRYEYAFEVSNRAGLYWYHPHPHGTTASQTQRGLFGMLFVEDDDERALRRALAVDRSSTELALLLTDRKSAAPLAYAPTAEDRLLGHFGDELVVNGTARPYCDVAARAYRLRIVNAANARTYRLAFRRPDGALLPFTLLGVDGGLLERPVDVRQLFVSPAERVDVWIDFGGLAIGDFVVAESLAFDPMQALPRPSGAARLVRRGGRHRRRTS